MVEMIIFFCTLGMYGLSLFDGAIYGTLFFGVCILAMSLASYKVFEGTPFNHSVKTFPVLNYLARRFSNDEFCNKQNDRSLFIFVFSWFFVLLGGVSVFIFSDIISDSLRFLVILISAFIFSTYMVRREKKLDV